MVTKVQLGKPLILIVIFMNKYVLWDLDGTIVDSENVSFKREMFRYASELISLKFNLEPSEYIGHEGATIFKKIVALNNKNLKEYLLKYEFWYESAIDFVKKNINEVKPRENIIQIWKELVSKQIYNIVVTSSREDLAKAYMCNIGLDIFCKSYTCLNHISNPKPNPEPYLYTLEKLNLDRNNCIVIEDSFSGITSAKAADLFTVAWVIDINDKKFSAADIVTDKLSSKLIINLFEERNCKLSL
jgi:HAD superfamily hydrolase (TIGR01509 family)